jgi:hypothetical protein
VVVDSQVMQPALLNMPIPLLHHQQHQLQPAAPNGSKCNNVEPCEMPGVQWWRSAGSNTPELTT